MADSAGMIKRSRLEGTLFSLSFLSLLFTLTPFFHSLIFFLVLSIFVFLWLQSLVAHKTASSKVQIYVLQDKGSLQQLQRSCSHLLLLDMEIFLTLKWIIPFIEQHFLLISVFIMLFFFNLSSVILPVTEAAFEVFLAIKDGKLTLSITSLHVAGHFNIAILASQSQK